MAVPIRPDELDAVVRMIASQQARPERNISLVGVETEGIRAEFDALEPPWTTTARVARASDGSVVGATLVEIDLSLGRAWIYGPWVDGDDATWRELARTLLDAAIAQVPSEIRELECAGEVANARLRELALSRDWTPSRVNHVLVVDSAIAREWSQPTGIRTGTDGDLTVIEPLHGAEFPGTYKSARDLVNKMSVVVAEDADGEVVGYAAGRVHPDGEGYIDYVAVDQGARGRGIGRALVITLTQILLDKASQDQVALTVDEDRKAARALYASIGFRPLTSLVGYRTTR
jgi:ribosomal protein S18 acetylase RimI-like enzyme